MPITDAYRFHGVALQDPQGNDKQAKGECPFCGKSDHFFVNVESGQYNCRRCSSEGNLYTFLGQLHGTSLKSAGVHAHRLASLAADRGIPVEELKRWGVISSHLDPSTFLLPFYNFKGKIANLSRIVKTGGKWKPLGTPTCKLYPYGVNLLQKAHKILWVCEGPWDAMALSAALATVRNDGRVWVGHRGEKSAIRTQGVIAVPGAGTFAPEWLQLFAGREVRLVFDNDHPKESPTGQKIMPGFDGQKRVIKIASENQHSAKKILYIVWGKGGFDAKRPDGYDVRDLLKDAGGPAALTYLCEKLQLPKTISSTDNPSEQIERVEPIECASFDELCGHFQKHLYFTEAMRDTLSISLAVVASTAEPGEQLWFRIIGPPGSGKTTIAECLSVAREYCFPQSIVTGFHSGFTGGPGRSEPSRETSLVPQIDRKCVIIKDADTLINHSRRDAILSELRDIYDGSSRSIYRNGRKCNFEDLRNTFLLCGTDALRGLNRSFLGERFLDCDILGNSSTGEYLDSAMRSAFSTLKHSFEIPAADGKTSEAQGVHSKILKQVTYGYLQGLLSKLQARSIMLPTATNRVQVQLKSMAQLLSFVRARVEREHADMCYRPRPELATRLVKQFVKLACFLAIVWEKSSIDDHIMSIVAKVLWDTANGYPLEVINFLYSKPNGASSLAVVGELQLSEEFIRRLLNDMLEIGSLTRRIVPNNSGFGGRNAHLWFLSSEVRELFRLSNLAKVSQ